MKTKVCTKCNETKPVSEYYKNMIANDGRVSRCKCCMIAFNKAKATKHPDYFENQRLIREYGLTLGAYRVMHKAQRGCCAICNKKEDIRDTKKMAVDHCHDTGAIRGLLCLNCNMGLGQFKDSTEALLKAALYLKKHGK